MVVALLVVGVVAQRLAAPAVENARPPAVPVASAPVEVPPSVGSAPAPEPPAAPAEPAAVSAPASAEAPADTEVPRDPRVHGLTHVVQPGESLAVVAGQHGLQVETVLVANMRSDAALVLPGEELRIPPADGIFYTVQPGDSVRALAEASGTAVGAIIDVNHLDDPDSIMAGDELVIPGPAPGALAASLDLWGTQVAAGAGGATPLPAPLTYEVQPGDTLAALGTKFGVDLETLLATNAIRDPNTIRPGTTLRILPVSGVEHEVAAGERLADIAARFDTSVSRILEFNRIADPDLINAGDTLVIPGGRHTAETAPAASAAKPAAAAAAAPQRASAPPAASQPQPAQAPAPALAPATATRGDPGIGQRIVAEALKYNGYRYVWGGTSPSTGFDSSGFPWYVFKQVGLPIPLDKLGQYHAGRHVGPDELQPGDMVFFQNTYKPGLSHNGIYIGNRQMIHAADESLGVLISSVDSAYYRERWYGATRVGW